HAHAQRPVGPQSREGHRALAAHEGFGRGHGKRRDAAHSKRFARFGCGFAAVCPWRFYAFFGAWKLELFWSLEFGVWRFHNMSLSASRSRLSAITKEIWSRWQDTKKYW